MSGTLERWLQDADDLLEAALGPWPDGDGDARGRRWEATIPIRDGELRIYSSADGAWLTFRRRGEPDDAYLLPRASIHELLAEIEALASRLR